MEPWYGFGCDYGRVWGGFWGWVFEDVIGWIGDEWSWVGNA